MGSRTKARARALQVLYAWEIRGGDEPLRHVDSELTAPDRPPLNPDAREYADRLLDVVESNHPQIDSRIESHADNWRLSRMTTIDRNILRIAAAEMLFFNDVPLKVSLQEAILLAEWFGTEESRRFVNGMLDALLRELEPEQIPDAR